MSWHDLPATEDTDWCSVDFLQQFVDAHNERAIWTPTWLEFWVTTNVYRYPLMFADVAEGQVYPAHTNISASGWSITTTGPPLYTIPKGLWDLGLAQRSLEFMAARYTKPSTIPANHSNTTYPTDLTLTEWRSAAGLPSTGFTRKYPREIASPAAGGTSGWRARALSDLRFYEHSGSAWVLSSDQVSGADLLTANGLMQPGDYIGPWLFNELRAGLDALSTVHWFGGLNAFHDAPPLSSGASRRRSGSINNQPDADTARSEALDRYEDDGNSNFSISAGGGFNVPEHWSLWFQEFDGQYSAQLGHYDVRFGFTQPGLEIRVRMFARYTDDPISGDTTEFDDWGLNIVPERWSLLHDATLERDDHVIPTWDHGAPGPDFSFNGFLTNWMGPPDLPAPSWSGTDAAMRGFDEGQGLSVVRHGTTFFTYRLLVIEPTFEYHA